MKKKKIRIKQHHLSYLFSKYNKICFNLPLEELYDYCNNIDEIGIFCRDIQIKNILNNENKIFTYKHIIFFTEESINRLIASQYILIDATFVFPKDYSQTLIIMYYDKI